MPRIEITPTTPNRIARASGRCARSWSLTSSRQAARTATRLRPVVLRPDLPFDRRAREVFDRRRVAMVSNLTPAPPATAVLPDASLDHTLCGPETLRGSAAWSQG